MATPDSTEELVCEYLNHCGFTDVVYEPDGNVPPDFLVNGKIAIEVRRLNQNHVENGKTKGIEEVTIPLRKRVEALIATFGAPTRGESWFVSFRFGRPVESWKTLGPKLQKALEAFRDAPIQNKGMIASVNGFQLSVFRASIPHSTLFLLGGYSDHESGGWLLSEMQKNIQHCVKEKSEKTAKVRSKYGQWWLALVDQIGYGLDEFDRAQFKETLSISHDWDKVIIIDPRDPTRWFEI